MHQVNITLETTGLQGRLVPEQPLTTVLQNTVIAILIFDAEGHLLFTNPAGRKLSDDCELKLGQRLPEDSGCESLQQLLDKASYSHVSLTEEVVWPDKRIFSAEISPVQGDSYVVALYDVSRFKELERLKNEFIARAAHDLRSPMTSIKGFNDLIKKVGPLNESQNEFLARVQTATEHMEELVENMLNLTKLNLGAKQEFETFNLSSLIWEVTDEVQPHAEVKNLRLCEINTIERNENRK
jgi:two-component system phosphate regulon sensor histidine kinase PhoR